MARHLRRLIVWTTGVLLSLALLATIVIALLIWAVDPDRYRGRIEQAATEALGRRVQLAGTLRWRPGFSFQVESQDGRIANAPGFAAAPFVSWRSLRLGLALRPLLDRRVVVDRVEVDGLQVNLARRGEAVNWQLPPSAPAQPGRDAFQLSLARIGLRDATVAFVDETRGSSWSASQLSLDVNLPPQLTANVLRFTGIAVRARLKGAPLEQAGIALQADLQTLELDRMQGRIVAPQWRVKWNDAGFQGRLEATYAGQPAAEGSLHVELPSLRRMLRSVSIALPATRDAEVFGPMTASVGFKASNEAVQLAVLDARLDATHLTGQFELPSLSPPALRFEIAADQLDADRYLPPADAPGAPLELPLAQLRSMDAKGSLTIQRATVAGAAARELRIDVE
jgi:AsmA protein